MIGRPIRIAATGNVLAADGGMVHGMAVTPGTDVTTITIREKGAGGTILFTLKAPANDPTFAMDLCWRWEGQLHVTVVGAAAELTLLT